MSERPLIPASVMAKVRGTAERTHTTTCQRLTPATGRSPSGAPLDGYTPLGGPVPCRVDPAGNQPAERAFGGQLGAEVRYIVALPVGTDIQPKHRIEVAGETLEVTAVTDIATYAAEIYAACTDVD